jgi:CheY-like chemotaxis protein
MIAKRFFDTARILICDPVASNRNATRASLHSLGYRNVDAVAALDILANRLQTDPPDLLLTEVAGAESETCALIQGIRQGQLADNPFIVIIATTWRRDGSIIGQVVNSGADDLVARPVSATVLGERIRLLTERRKGFVVTYDYIGPDRRRNARADGPSAESVEAPNPLKLRAMDGLSDEEVARQLVETVRHGREKLNREKVRRDAVQLCLQWRMLERRSPGARDFCEVLPRIGRLAAEVKRRAALTNQGAAQKWCDSIAQSLEGLIEMTARPTNAASPADYQALLSPLGHAALSLGQMFAAEEVSPSRLVELDDIVAVRTARSAAA